MYARIMVAVGFWCLLGVGAVACARGFEPLSGSVPAAAPGGRAAQGVVEAGVSDRLIVRTANLRLLVDNVASATARTQEVATSRGGFVVAAQQREDAGAITATVTIRVPATQLDQALTELRALAVRIRRDEVSGRDVTEEVVDTDARLRNLRATESRYLDLLQQARSVTDVLAIEAELTKTRGQIEQLQGRLQVLRQSVDLAAITVDLQPFNLAQAIGPDFSPLPVVTTAWASLLGTLALLVSGVIWIVVFAPLWGSVAAVAWFLRRYLGRRQRARPPVQADTTVSVV